jgi:hypothetical protein
MSTSTSRILRAVLCGAAALAPATALATPSTTYWAPSVATCQAYKTPHVTYDTYYGKQSYYPIDTGLTMGILPGDKVQAEVGYDLFMPGDPTQFYVNAKLCVTENTLFKGGPSIGVGISNVGFKKDVTDYNMLYVVAQKSLPFGGFISIGGYHGMSDTLFVSSEGKKAQNGLLAAWSSPDIAVPIKGISKINVLADVQTGKNSLGAGGAGLDIYFNDYIGVIVGPVFYFDKALQPGGASHFWTTQLDVDIPLGRK